MASPESQPDTPRVAVCVSTYNRAHLLPRLVAALESQTLGFDEFELVIVDDASPDNTRTVLQELQERSPLQITVLRQGANQGPAAGRNRAWRAARAPIIAFTDDDCVPTPFWLGTALRRMTEGRYVGVGRTMPHPDQMHLAGPFSYTLVIDTVDWFATCNVFFHRADLEHVGGFDEKFRAPAGEDTDLGLRVVEGGSEALFIKDSLVYHDVRPDNFWHKLRDQKRWIDIPAVIAAHPGSRERMLHHKYFWKTSHWQAMLLLAGVALAPRNRKALLLAAPWLHLRTCLQPLCEGPRRRWAILPGALTLDVVEIAMMAAGSVKHRTVVL